MSRKANRGVSLIEIMIGLVLGLILIASVSSLVLAGRQTSRSERNLLQMQATGRIATELLAREIRKAGYRSNREQPIATIFPVSAAPFLKAGSVVAGSAAGGDISLRYQGNGDVWLTDCLGNPVGVGEDLWQTLSLVGGELRCHTRNLTANTDETLALAAPIEAMAVSWGVDTTGDGYADSYASSGAVTDWSKVASVNVQVRVSSLDDSVADAPQAYLDFNGTAVTPNDRRLRRTYATVIALRNLLP